MSEAGYIPPWTTTRTPPAGRAPPLPARSFRTALRAPASVARGAASVPLAASSPCGATCITMAGAGREGSSARCSARSPAGNPAPHAWFPQCGAGPRRGSRAAQRRPRQDAARALRTHQASARSRPRRAAPRLGLEAGPRRRARPRGEPHGVARRPRRRRLPAPATPIRAGAEAHRPRAGRRRCPPQEEA